VYDVFAPKWHPRFTKKGARNDFLVRGAPSRARPARPASRAGWPGRPGLASPAARSRLAGRCAAPRGGGEKREEQRREAARRPNPAPPLLSPQVGYLVYDISYILHIDRLGRPASKPGWLGWPASKPASQSASRPGQPSQAKPAGTNYFCIILSPNTTKLGI